MFVSFILSTVQGLPTLTSMAVVVQELVQGRVSGVCFTADPLTGDRGKVLTLPILFTQAVASIASVLR